jgi:hypothetical protein
VEKIESFVRLVNSSERVTHNYLRDNNLNVWFTFCSEDSEQLRQFFDYLTKESGVNEIYDIPAQKVYKIQAIFNLKE